jgi:ribosomal protein S18 acetylase RimI-like enzyme
MENIRAKIATKNGEEVVIRPLLSNDDIKGLIDFRRSISEETQTNFAPHNYTNETISAYIERNREGLDLIYIAWCGNRVIAYFFLWEFDEAVPVLGIGIHDEYQGQGLGLELINILIEDGRGAGKAGIALTVMPENSRAIYLYEKMGFYHSADVENLQEGGKVYIVPEMFLPLKEGAAPIKRKHAPPVM